MVSTQSNIIFELKLNPGVCTDVKLFFTSSEFVNCFLLAVAEKVCLDSLRFEDVSVSARTCARHI